MSDRDLFSSVYDTTTGITSVSRITPLKSVETGDKQRLDDGKLPYELLPFDALERVTKVLEFGAKKYSQRGWENGMHYSRVFAPTLRHLFKWWRGEENDTETGLSHLAHAATNVLFLLAYTLRDMSPLDDRSPNERRP